MTILLLGFLSLLFIPVPSETFLWRAVYNFGHVPLFGVVAILLLWVSRELFKSSAWPGLRQYGIALLGALVLALVTEVLQSLDVARESSVSDIVHDLIGATCGLVLFFIFDKQLSGSWVQWRQFPRNVLLCVCVVLVLCFTLGPVVEWAYAYWDRAKRFPALIDFSSDWEMKFVKENDSELSVVIPPEGWKHSSVDYVGRVTFHPKKYPGIHLQETYPDWRGYTYLVMDVYSELSNPQTIALRIDDLYYTNRYDDGFNRRIEILPGLNHIKIAIEDIRQAPVDRETDLSAMRKFLLFAKNPPEEFTLYFDNVRLE